VHRQRQVVWQCTNCVQWTSISEDESIYIKCNVRVCYVSRLYELCTQKCFCTVCAQYYSSTVVQYILHIHLYIYKVCACVCVSSVCTCDIKK
jgi:hypothetical protein